MDLLKKQIFEKVKEFYLHKKKNNFIPGISDVPVSGKFIDHVEASYITEAALDGWLTTGRFNDQFQKDLANFINIKSLITANSGSSANFIAFSSLCSDKMGDSAIKKNDEVISVAAGFPTTVNPILTNGCIPVFVDIKLGTYNIDENLIENAISKKTKAIVLAHTLGNPFNLDVIKKICNRHKLLLMEDCCDALGSTYNGKHVGTFGDVATLSFYPAHHITMGEGGAVFTNSIKIKRVSESIRDWGRDCYCEPGKDNTCGKRFNWQLGDLPYGFDHKYTYSNLGYNFKITDMQAACGLAQLEKLNFFIKKRKENFKFLKKNLLDLDDFLILPEHENNSDPSWFGFLITLRDESILREDLLKFLNEKKIGTRLLFSGNLTKQPYMKNYEYKISGKLENTDKIMKQSFWIGLHPSLDDNMLEYSVGQIRYFFKNYKKK